MKKSPRIILSLLHLLIALPLLFQIGVFGVSLFYIFLKGGKDFTATGILIFVVSTAFLFACFKAGFYFVKFAYFPKKDETVTMDENAVSTHAVAPVPIVPVAPVVEPSRNFFVRYLGVVIVFSFALIMAVVAITLSNEDGFEPFFMIFGVTHLASLLLFVVATTSSHFPAWLFVLPPFAIYIAYFAGMIRCFHKMHIPHTNPRGWLVSIFVLFLGTGIFVSKTVKIYESFLKPVSEKNLRELSDSNFYQNYIPFDKGNKLVRIPAPVLTISENHPRLDGATGLYPVYAAAVQAIYKGISQAGIKEHAKVNPSPEAYANLIEGRTDILFALQPSPEQIAAAKAKGVSLQLTPLGREAFVFFVNAANPVDNLSSEQLRAIYAKRIVNWKEVGGKDVRILPFQRRKNSGSQTAMELQVMRGEKMSVPLWDEYAQDMFGIVRRTADYRNADTALGYSFRFFALKTGEKNIKLLKVDGIAPTLESIRDESYPYTSTAYAVTTNVSAQKPHVRELIEWFAGAQGQKLISDTGYAPLK